MIGDRWGVTDQEVLAHYPCDDLVPVPGLSLWRGVSVAASPDTVWAWLTQVRVAPYSYDCLDNLGRRSPRRLLRLPDPVVGEPFTTAGGRRLGRIVGVDPGRALTATIMGAVMSYAVVPAHNRTTRLLLKIVVARPGAAALVLSLGDLVMARRQLLTFKELAEGTERSGEPPVDGAGGGRRVGRR